MRAAIVGAASAGAVVLATLPSAAAEPGFAPIEVHARPIEQVGLAETTARFGALEFRGGLVLSSTDGRFGSWSGLDFGADGKTFYAVADDGMWFTARIVEEGDRLVGIDNPMLAPMLDSDGEPIAGKSKSDAEGLRIVEHGGVATALVSFEQTAEVRAFAAEPDFASATPRRVVAPNFIPGLRPNQGLEAIAVAPSGGRLAGATVVISERPLDASGDHRAFILDGPRY